MLPQIMPLSWFTAFCLVFMTLLCLILLYSYIPANLLLNKKFTSFSFMKISW